MIETLLETPRFRVEHRVYEEPEREPIQRYVVVHPGAVVILPRLEDGRIVMIRQLRRSVGEALWELPAGTLEPGETPIDTARRELIEETGYRAGRMEPLIEFYTSPGFCTERMYAFVAADLTPVGQKLEGSERIEVIPLAADEVRHKVVSGELRDGKTIATLGCYFLQPPTETKRR